ncbi:MAG: hypothetical protein QE272_09640 [Nevskia sp.]|nr:hypothetical protein [Nevskia sp.]
MSSLGSQGTATEHRRHQRGGARPVQLAVIAVVGALLLHTGVVAALGIGEPSAVSHLFEPLQIDIPVDTQGVTPSTVKVAVRITGVDAAAARELQRRLLRQWRVDASGQPLLRIRADAVIQEPLLEMRVVVSNDEDRAARNLTLLFDPAPVGAQPVARDARPKPAPKPAALTPAAPRRPAAATPTAKAPAKAAPIAAQAPSRTSSSASRRESPAAAAPASAPVPASAAPALAVAAAVAATPSTDRASVRPRTQALASADRWQRLPVGSGDTLDTLAAQARGQQTAVPLSLVAMLLRWLNPRSFDGAGLQPKVGSELRFPSAESLAAQLAASDGHWQDGAAGAAAASDASEQTLASVDAPLPVPATRLPAPVPAPAASPVLAVAAPVASVDVQAPLPLVASSDDLPEALQDSSSMMGAGLVGAGIALAALAMLLAALSLRGGRRPAYAG